MAQELADGTTEVQPEAVAAEPQATETVNEHVDPLDQAKFTQRDLNALEAKFKRKYKPQQPKQAKPEEKSDLSAEFSALKMELQTERLERQFAESVSQYQLDPKMRNILRTNYMAERPDDPAEWARDNASLLTKTSPAPRPEPTPAPDNSIVSASPQPDPQGSVADGTLNPKDLTAAHVDSMGEDALTAYVEKKYGVKRF